MLRHNRCYRLQTLMTALVYVGKLIPNVSKDVKHLAVGKL